MSVQHAAKSCASGIFVDVSLRAFKGKHEMRHQAPKFFQPLVPSPALERSTCDGALCWKNHELKFSQLGGLWLFPSVESTHFDIRTESWVSSRGIFPDASVS